MGVDSIVVPRKLAKKIHEHLSNLTDEGPPGEGWKSEELIEDIKVLEGLLRDNPTAFDKPRQNV